MKNNLLKPDSHDTTDSISLKNKLNNTVAPNKTSDMISLINMLPCIGILTSQNNSNLKLKKKFLNSGPPTLKNKFDSKGLKKKLKNVGPPNLPKISDSKNLKRKWPNADELLDLKSSAPSDGFKPNKVGKQDYRSTFAGHHKHYSMMNKSKSVKDLPVVSEVVDYPINLTGKGKFQW